MTAMLLGANGRNTLSNHRLLLTRPNTLPRVFSGEILQRRWIDETKHSLVAPLEESIQ